MRCKWKEAAASEKLHDHGLMFLKFCEVSAGRVLMEYTGYGRDRLTGYFNGMWSLFSEDLNFYADEKSDIYDAAETMLTAQERELETLGVDIHAIDEQLDGYDTFGKKWRSAADRIIHANRVAYIKQMERSVRGYHYSTLLWMRDNKNYGAKRISELYRRLRKEWCIFAGYYFDCTPAGDHACLRMIKEYEDDLNKKGVSIDIEEREKDGNV